MLGVSRGITMTRYESVQCRGQTADGDQCTIWFGVDHATADEDDYYCQHHKDQARQTVVVVGEQGDYALFRASCESQEEYELGDEVPKGQDRCQTPSAEIRRIVGVGEGSLDWSFVERVKEIREGSDTDLVDLRDHSDTTVLTYDDSEEVGNDV